MRECPIKTVLEELAANIIPLNIHLLSRALSEARAIRRAGELLKQIDPAHGANQNIREGCRLNVQTRSDAARDAGMSKHQQVQSTRVANVSDEDFEAQVEAEIPVIWEF
jgi:hypothetical protein